MENFFPFNVGERVVIKLKGKQRCYCINYARFGFAEYEWREIEFPENRHVKGKIEHVPLTTFKLGGEEFGGPRFINPSPYRVHWGEWIFYADQSVLVSARWRFRPWFANWHIDRARGIIERHWKKLSR